MKESIIKFLSKHKLLLGLFSSQFFILLILLFTESIKYATNDDTTMVALVSGAYGFANEYVINMNILIGYLLKYLFLFFPIINWMTILFLVFILYSFLTIDIILIQRIKKSKKYVAFFYYIIIDITFLFIIGYFTFTVVSYILLIGAVLCYLKYTDNTGSKIYFINGTVLTTLSIMVRSDCILSISIFLLPLLMYTSIKMKEYKRSIIVACSILSLFISITQLDSAIQNRNPIQKEFYEWGDARSKAMDAPALDYEEYKSKFEKFNISYNSYAAAYNAFYFDQKSIPKEMFEYLANMPSVFKRYNFDMFQYIQYLKDRFYSKDYINIIISFSLTIFLFTIMQKKNRIPKVLSILNVFLIDFIFFFIQRSLYRVTMPHFVLLILVLLFYYEHEDYCLEIIINKRKIRIMLGKLQTIMISIFCYSIVLSFLGNNSSSIKTIPSYDSSNLSVIDYLKQNNDTLYLVGSASLFSLDTVRPIMDFAGSEGEYWNLIGNWEIYSYPYEYLMDKYSVTDKKSLLKESIDSNSIKYITNYGLELPEFVIPLIKEKYNIDVEIIETDKLESDIPVSNIRVWKIISK